MINYKNSNFASVFDQMHNSVTRMLLTFAVAVFVLMFAFVPASAQDTKATEQAAPVPQLPANPAIQKGVAFVNLARIFKESEFIGSKRQLISEEFVELEKELEAKIETLEQRRQKQNKERLTLTKEQLQTEIDALNDMELEIQRTTRNLQEDKRLRFDVVQRDLEGIILETIQEISSSRENFIVFDLSTILFADASLEITEEVIQLLDKKTADQ